MSVPTVLDCAVPLYRNTALASSRDVHVCRPPCGRLMTLLITAGHRHAWGPYSVLFAGFAGTNGLLADKRCWGNSARRPLETLPCGHTGKLAFNFKELTDNLAPGDEACSLRLKTNAVL